MIGTKARWMTGALVSAGLMLGSIGAAQAQPGWGGGRGWDRGGWDRHHRHRGDGFGVGDAIGVAAIVGAVAIVASSMNKDKKARDAAAGADYDAPPPRAGTDYGADVRDGASTRDEADFSDVAAGDDALTDACALAARDEAQGQSGYAEIRHIAAPRPAQDGTTNIDGEVETRASYRAASGTTRRFTCAMKDGRVTQVYLSRDVVMQ
ncbi:hypothetical protein [Sphingobium sp.]|uniref:hypothetical protein n=1 Tax=Sphingobium sp. TaxID=1912891 RepID=UPI0026152299|nr:hypothetical protein [Sphingobium sp.]